ncbi:MAG TPA: AAA family ATPase [Mycobacterium sp.]|nr:AAA family ATPase [Mycobacterium sp.]
MPIRWNVPQHAAALEQLNTALDRDAPGAAVLGADGAGKSTLARLAAEDRARRHPATLIRWVIGTPSEGAVPFGAFSHLVQVADVGKPAALLRAARASLVGDGREGDLLVVVDDAQHLDVLSATLVYQLALAGAARMIVTARADGAPEAVAALWGDGLLQRIDVAAPGRATSPADVDGFLAGLPAPARSVLDYLAVQEPLSLADLTGLAGDDAVRQAEELGAAETRVRGGHGPDPVVYTAHPLFAERALVALGSDGARRLRTELVTLLSTHGAEHVSDRLRLASLAVDSDAAQPADQVAAAAQQALRLGDLPLAERLARSAVDRSGGLAARLTLAHALAWQGRGRDADAVLSGVDPGQLSEPELMAWALPQAANQFFMLSEPAKATAFLQATRDRITAPVPRATLDGLAATFAMNAGTPLRALRISGEVLASPHADAVAVGWAASAAALSSARVGRFDDVDALAARAQATEHPGLLRFTSGFGRVLMLLMTGRLDEARSVAQRHTDFAELQQPGRAIGEVLVAYVATAQGDFDTAVRLLQQASDALLPTGYSWGPLALMLLAQALGQRGESLEAAKVLGRAESRHGLKSALFAPELALAKAWSKAARGDTTGAIEAARAAVQAAERGGQAAIALRALQDAARLGDTQAVYRAQRLSVEVDCVLGRLTIAHARALAAGDSIALGDVAADLAEAGLHPAAADAGAQAQRCGSA